MQRWKIMVQQIQKESVAEAELDEEFKGLQAADERGGSSASKSTGCCMGPTFLRSFLTPGADLAWQQLVLLQSEVGKTHGAQHQPAPVTPVHFLEAGEENEEGQRISASREFDGQPRGRNQGFLAGSDLDTSSLP